MALDPAIDAHIGASIALTIATSNHGHAFAMEQGRLNHLAGVMSTREGLTHRIIGESGGGQARAFLPGGMGGTPTVVPAKPVGT